MYHYTESGLPNVWLANGYTEKTIHGEKAVSITDADQLFQEIGRALTRKANLAGIELRFLRKELGLSQARVAQLVGASEQTVSLWERGEKIPVAAQRLVKLVYLAQIDGNDAICDALSRIIELDAETEQDKFIFEDTSNGWKEAA